LRKLARDESVYRIHRKPLAVRRHLRLLQRIKCPVTFIHRTLLDPPSEQADLPRRELPILLRRRHVVFRIRRHDPAQQRRARLLIGAVWLGSLLIVAGLVAILGARPAGPNHAAELAVALKDVDVLKTRVAMLTRSEQVAKSALADVQQTLRDREEEIDGLRADLAFYGRLVGGNTAITRVTETASAIRPTISPAKPAPKPASPKPAAVAEPVLAAHDFFK
jgi:hypothetical protein